VSTTLLCVRSGDKLKEFLRVSIAETRIAIVLRDRVAAVHGISEDSPAAPDAPPSYLEFDPPLVNPCFSFEPPAHFAFTAEGAVARHGFASSYPPPQRLQPRERAPWAWFNSGPVLGLAEHGEASSNATTRVCALDCASPEASVLAVFEFVGQALYAAGKRSAGNHYWVWNDVILQCRARSIDGRAATLGLTWQG
jgi:hypothetical protein